MFPLHWTVVHPIDEESPLHNLSQEGLAKTQAEFLVYITAIDDTFSQTVHARSSYRYDEVMWKARFADIFRYSDGGIVSVDLSRLSELETGQG